MVRRLIHSVLAVDIVQTVSLAFCAFIVCLTANGSNCLPEIKPVGQQQHRRTLTQARKQTCARCHMRLVPTVADPAPSKSLRGKELLAAKFRWDAAGTAGTVGHA